MTIETPEQITAAEIISKIKPFNRIDADLVIVLRDRLISKTGCSWETARQCILTELNKRAGVKIPPEYADKNRSSDPGGRPKSNHPYPPNKSPLEERRRKWRLFGVLSQIIVNGWRFCWIGSRESKPTRKDKTCYQQSKNVSRP